MPAVTDELVHCLTDFQATTPDIEAAAIVSVDGVLIASALPPDVEEARVGAMSAALVSLSRQIASELGRGAFEQVFVRGEYGYVVLVAVGQGAVLAALARREAQLGMIFLGMKRVAGELAQMV